MLTCIRALNDVHGAEILLIGCLLCLFAAFTVAFLIKSNRGRRNGIITAVTLAVSAAVGDLCLYLCFFSGGEYVNGGLASAGYSVIFPVCLLIGSIAVSLINKRILNCSV